MNQHDQGPRCVHESPRDVLRRLVVVRITSDDPREAELVFTVLERVRAQTATRAERDAFVAAVAQLRRDAVACGRADLGPRLERLMWPTAE
jgi:hypothetical protein